MITALDSNGNKVDISDAVDGEKYFCECCGGLLTPRNKKHENRQRIPHFAHKDMEDCDGWSHEMSEWHIKWQKRFPLESREVVVEKNGVKHRADVLINDIVIEFQHSPIKAEEIEERNNFYLSCGYGVVWVFDADGKIKNGYDENGIDPMRKDPIVWKVKKTQFSSPMPRGVDVYLEYTIPMNVDGETMNIPIMVLLREVDPKVIKYRMTKEHIMRWNFCQQMGVEMIPGSKTVNDLLVPEYMQYKNETTWIFPKRGSGRRFHF